MNPENCAKVVRDTAPKDATVLDHSTRLSTLRLKENPRAQATLLSVLVKRESVVALFLADIVRALVHACY